MTGNRWTTLVALIVLGGLGAGAVVYEIAARGFSDNRFFGLALLQSLIALAAARIVRDQRGRAVALAVFAGAVAFRLMLLAQPPLLSDDIYRYVWDGRVVNAGFNPLSHVPADPELAFLRDEAIYPLVDKKDYAVTIYPPMAQAVFALVTFLSGGLYAMKLAMLAFEALAVAAMWSLLRRLGKNPLLVVAYLWHPAPIWEIANNGHVDAVMMALLLAAFAWGAPQGWRFARGQPYRAGALMALAALAKPYGALWLAAIWKPFDVRLPLFVLAVATLCYLPFASAGTGIFGFLGTYLHEQGLDTGNGFYFVGLFSGFGAQAAIRNGYLASAALLLLAMAVLLARRPDRTIKMRLHEAQALTLTFLFVLSPVYPWYFLLAAPFVALTGSWCAFAMMTTGFWLYTFNADQFEFPQRWGLSLAIIAMTGGVDVFRTWRRRKNTESVT